MGIFLKKNSMDFQLTKFTILRRENQVFLSNFFEKKREGSKRL